MSLLQSIFLTFVLTLSLLNCEGKIETTPDSPQNPIIDRGENKLLLEYERNSNEVFEANKLAVVGVTNIRVRRSFFNSRGMEMPAGQGSGFVWDQEGHIVTNFHVVQGGEKFMISFHIDLDLGRDAPLEFEAIKVGEASKFDIAVLKLKNFPLNKLRAVRPGNSRSLVVGQKALAIGSPLGLGSTLTGGLVSQLNRRMEGVGGVEIYGMIQTDAAINRGNSGGPLINSSGEVIGMNTMILSPSGGNINIGFAVPIDTIKEVVPQLIENGELVTPAIGVALYEDPAAYYFLGIKKGVMIGEVFKSGPADRAGLKGIRRNIKGQELAGDIILKIEDTEVNSHNDIFHALLNQKIGGRVKITLKRGDKIMTKPVKLERSDKIFRKH